MRANFANKCTVALVDSTNLDYNKGEITTQAERACDMEKYQYIDDTGSRDVARAAVMVAMTPSREEERRLKEQYAQQEIRVAAVDFGGEFSSSISRMVERCIVASKREGVISDTMHEEGTIAGAVHEAIMQIAPKATGLNVGGKIGMARKDQHVVVTLFLAIGLAHLNEICLGMGHRSV